METQKEGGIVMAIIIQGIEQIMNFRMKALRAALKLECLGMKRRGPSVYGIVKKEFGLKGTKQEVLEKLDQLIKGGI